MVKDSPDSGHIKKKCKFNGLTGKIITPCLPVQRPSIAGAAAPTATEVIEVDAVLSKEGCDKAMAAALEATSARKTAGQVANNMSWRNKKVSCPAALSQHFD